MDLFSSDLIQELDKAVALLVNININPGAAPEMTEQAHILVIKYEPVLFKVGNQIQPLEVGRIDGDPAKCQRINRLDRVV
jgi:hypothetical protein